MQCTLLPLLLRCQPSFGSSPRHRDRQRCSIVPACPGKKKALIAYPTIDSLNHNHFSPPNYLTSATILASSRIKANQQSITSHLTSKFMSRSPTLHSLLHFRLHGDLTRYRASQQSTGILTRSPHPHRPQSAALASSWSVHWPLACFPDFP